MRVPLLAAVLIASSMSATETQAVEIALWRMDCGRFDNVDMSVESDDDRYVGRRRNGVDSCYLIRHDEDYMLWDVGMSVGLKLDTPIAAVRGPERGIVAQMAEIGVKPEQVRYIGISHGHPDHTGQAGDFPHATLLIGAGDWPLNAVPGWMKADTFDPWLKGGSKVEPIDHDMDVFGDRSVVIFATPGHTPGHHSLMIHLKRTGTVLLSGDLFSLRENYRHNVVHGLNTNRADTLASFDRFKKLAAYHHALVIVQHEPGDVAKLPRFPEAAR